MTKFTHPKDAPEGHKWTLRSGELVEIFKWDVKHKTHTIAGLFEDSDGQEWVSSWTVEGKRSLGMGDWCGDLIDAPVEHDMWVNVYPDGDMIQHETREEADGHAAGPRIACIHVTYTEGEGLE